MRSALPTWTLLEQILKTRVLFEAVTDNTAAEAIVVSGYSKSLRHMRKHHRVSVSLMRDIYYREDATLGHV